MAGAHQVAYEHGIDGRSRGTHLGCALVERDTGQLVGWCSLRLERHPEIGYWLARRAWGRGYAAEAVRAVVEWGFAADLHRLTILCDTRNVASARTAQIAGFAFEGISRDGYASDGGDAPPAQRGDLARFARLATDSGAPVTPTLPPLPANGLSDEIIRLRVTVADDAVLLHELDDSEALRWSFRATGMTVDEARVAAAESGLHWLVSRRGLRLTLVDVASGVPAGGMSLRLTGPPGVCSIGYAIHPAFRGRGYTTRALRLFASWAFGTAGLARLELGARTGNVASQHSARNAGFLSEGRLTARLRAADGTFHDEARFALLNPALRGGVEQGERTVSS